jgi:hypothetical protein
MAGPLYLERYLNFGLTLEELRSLPCIGRWTPIRHLVVGGNTIFA